MNKKIIRILSAFLTVLFLLSSFCALTVTVDAAATTDPDEEEPLDLSSIDYLNEVYRNPQEKLDTMTLFASKYNFDLYFNDYTGEAALVDKTTGEIMLTNPYDVASSVGAVTKKSEILSQIVIRFTDNTGSVQNFDSYTQAAKRKQISVEKIKGGVRVEYILGDENSRKLVPRMISKNSFENLILAPMAKTLGTDNYWYIKLSQGFYVYYDYEEFKDNEVMRNQIVKEYPIVETIPIYVFAEDALASEINKMEELIKQYAPDYSFEQMEIDYAEVGYDSTADVSPVFKMALEYFINEDGLSVRLPANGIRFNSSLYKIESISVLPYLGCGNSANEGYTFFPDGSGTLFDFQELANAQETTIRSKIYGTDFAYYSLTGKYQKPLRYAVFGVHEQQQYFQYSATITETDEEGVITSYDEDVTIGASVKDYKTLVTDLYKDKTTALKSEITSYTRDVGYLGVLEEGEALTEIATYHAGSKSDYHSIMTFFNPRPKDTYNQTGAVSVSGGSSWTVISARKYSGNYKVRYIMLHDPALAAAAHVTGSFATDYNGMALAYRNYLLGNEQIARLTASDVQKNIPLFIKTFGALETQENILTVPVTVLKPLTSFADIQKMNDDLNENGVKNVIYQMKGYSKGGLWSAVPYNLHWAKSVGGSAGFKKLLDYAEDINASSDTHIGIYPDFDFQWISSTPAFDGLNLKKHAIKAIDNRYTSHREYRPTMQQYVGYGELAVSPAYFEHFYTKLLKKYLKFDVTGISVSTLGETLNSDFDKKEPYNREDNKKFTKDAFAYLQEQVGSVMTSGGNSYCWPYIDYLVEAPLESSNYVVSSRNVPFFGMVMHGYLQYAGSAANMEGNSADSILKALENGGSLYYILSYENTEILKEDFLYSEYYSVNYDIWKESVSESYNELNGLMADLQTKLIINHEFLTGRRVPDSDELLADLAAELEAAAKAEAEARESERVATIKAINDARVDAIVADETLAQTLETLTAAMDKVNSTKLTADGRYSNLLFQIENYGGDLEHKAVKSALDTYGKAVVTLLNELAKWTPYEATCQDAVAKAEAAVEFLQNAEEVSDELANEAKAHLDNAKALLVSVMDIQNTLKTYKTEAIETALAAGVDESLLSGSSSTDTEPVFEEEEPEPFDKYLSDDGHIVAVTYGGKNGDDNARYRTFILNYNTYSVVIDYEGYLYTVPADSYAVINW